MKVLVTGGAGFIGSHLVERLVHEGTEITVLDNLTTGREENLKRVITEDNIHFVRGDIRDPEIVSRCAVCATIRLCRPHQKRLRSGCRPRWSRSEAW